MGEAEHPGPVVGVNATEPGAPRRPHWSRALGVAAGVVAVAAIGGVWWHRSKRRRRVEDELTPLSHEWLAEHYYKTGQSGDHD